MLKAFGKLCKASRDNAKITQEAAAELFCISARSLSDYERGITMVPEDIVLKMMSEYEDPLLGYFYLKLCNAVGQMILPDIKPRQLASSILSLEVEMHHVAGVQRDIAEVGQDDQIDPQERSRWAACTQELYHLISSAFSVILAPLQKEKTASARTAAN